MAGYLLPAADKPLSSSLAMIFGAEPKIEAGQLDAANATHIGLYVDADGNTVAACYCDMGAAVAMACALSLIPPGMAEDMQSSGNLTEVALENLHEVMNIFSSLYMNDNTDHLRLSHVDTLNGTLPSDCVDMDTSAFSIDSEKYPIGIVAFAKK